MLSAINSRAASVVDKIYRPIQNNKLKFLSYIIISLVGALLLSFILGEKYDGAAQKQRGAPRKRDRRETPSTSELRDPFANRPRIQTKNGHLVIEASQDKNIDFKTSGSRGTVTINGHKIDQLLDVTKALEKSVQLTASRTTASSNGQYEMVLRSLFSSGERFSKLEENLAQLTNRVVEMDKQVSKLSRRFSRRLQQVSKVSKQQENILAKLRRNDCFNADTGQSVCKNGATCLDTYDGFKCLCPPNYEGATCEQDVDECAKFRGTDLGCQNGAKCVNLPGSYLCECSTQYHGVHCTEQHDDCALSSSRSLCGFGKCINLARTVLNQARYECICEQGWTTDGTNPACIIDINECLVGQSPANLLPNTTNLDGSAPWSNSLMAAYPCSQNPFVDCINLPGSFQCGPCPPGYTGNGRVCRDLDECIINNGGCSTKPLVECINTQGSRRCGLCPAGYTGDGVSCSRVSACSSALEPNGGCHPMAKCVELTSVSLNSRLCICQYPYTGDGLGVAGCKPPGGLAINGNESSSTSWMEPARQDDCQPNPCLNNAQCQRTESSFECICPTGWSGRLCDEQNSLCGGRFYVDRGSLSFPVGSSFNELVKMMNSNNNNKQDPIDRHYNCSWSISVASNMSVQLIFNELTNKVTPIKKVQMYLANSTAHQTAPPCGEYLDVRERLVNVVDLLDQPAADNAIIEPVGRLLARFCSETRAGPTTKLSSLEGKRAVSIVAESNTVELEYHFSTTRTQFGEPSLGFNMTWIKIEPPCGGELPVSESGSISSPRFPEFYPPGTECRYLVRVPPGQRVRIQFGELNLLTSSQSHSSINCIDSLTILDGSIGSDRPTLFRHCANNATLMSKLQSPMPIISSSSTVEIILSSWPESSTPLMRPKQKRGFYLTYASESSTPGCGGLYTVKSATIKSSDYKSNDDELDSPEYSRLAQQLSGYNNFDYKENQLQPSSSEYPFLYSRIFSFRSFANMSKKTSRLWYRTRCEYEIRPADQTRNHKIALDWIDMPSATPTDANALSQWSRKLRCSKGRLMVYDGNPLDGSNRTEIASFCAGDKYNASIPASFVLPVVSSGHVLILIYESSHQPTDDNQLASTSIGPNGFKLHYSTVCSAIYHQLKGRIQVEIDSDVNECIHHIMLPPNNTISLVIEPKMSDSMILANGSCAAQAIFLDGAIQGGKLALLGAERQLKSYNFEQSSKPQQEDEQQSSKIKNNATRVGDTSYGSMASTGDGSNFYWQYSNSHVHDIKEFEVCKLPVLSFDSIWNHLSLLFRLNPRSSDRFQPKTRFQLIVRYQAEPSCGGIISEPGRGSLKLDSSRPISALSSYPITTGRFEQLHKQQFMNPCAWILRSAPNEIIQLKFDSPVSEIQRRLSNWLNWSKKQQNRTNTRQQQQQSALGDFNCSQVFQETIEVYEPALNRTRQICPTDLIPSNLITSWTTQSNIVYIRLRNNSDSIVGNNNSRIQTSWPGANKPLNGSAIVARYKFLSVRGQECGGKLLQDSGIISSPRFPFNYPPNSNCIWIIQANPRQQIRLNITKFYLEQRASCLFDYLELRNGPNSDSPLIGRFCNQDLKSKVIVSHSNFLWLHFKSDMSISGPGFEIHYDGAQTGCGGKLTTSSGQIDSPNYPQAYAHSSDCEWVIELSQSNKVELTIEDLDLSSSEQSSKCLTNGTKLDYLEIFDSSMEFLTKSLGKYCHKNQIITNNEGKAVFMSTNNKLFIVYKSQALDNSRGFRLTYRTICKPIELIGYRGIIESPGFPENYKWDLSCGWTIRAPLGSNLRLALTDMAIEYGTLATNGSIEYKPTSSSSYLRKCSYDFLDIWAIQKLEQQTMSTNHTTSNSSQFPVSFEYREMNFLSRRGVIKKQAQVPKNGKLVQSLCGKLNDLNDTERYIDLDTNVAYISFESDRSEEMSGFRIEWQSQGCGGQQIGETIQTITYHEGTNLTRPTECLWSFDLSKSANTLEFHLNSDMRSPDTSSEQGNNKLDACEEASLTIYDGLTDKATILSKNCDSQKMRETILTSSGQALVKFYTDGRHNYGRGFQLSGWPSNRDGCVSSVFDIGTPFNEQAGIKKSPNYPDLYDANKQYHCHGLLSARAPGRLRIHLEELDIPVDSDGQQARNLLSPEICQSSGNYLAIKSLVNRNVEEIFCGKFDKQEGSRDLARASVVLEQEAAWSEFYTKDGLQGRWKFTYDRLCGSITQVDYPQEFITPNYPRRPNWPKKGSDDNVEQSENVCIWRLKTNYPYSANEEREKKLHLNIVQFIESSNNNEKISTDCLRIYEGVNLSIRQGNFNITDIDLRFQPKIKICRQSDIKYSSLYYVSQGAELTVMITGNTVVKFQAKPFENNCGSEFHLNRAEFASLGYPQPYITDLDCHYFILGSPGSSINLKFLTFDLAEGEPNGNEADDSTDNTTKCDNTDYIEIRQLSIRKKVDFKLNTILSSISSLKKSDMGFLVSSSDKYSFKDNDSNSLTTDSSKLIINLNNSSIPAPTISERLHNLATFYYIFNQVSSNQYPRLGGYKTRMSLNLDDFYESSTLLGRFCGKQAPKFSDQQLRDEILVRFRSHGAKEYVASGQIAPRGFLAEYRIDYGGLIQLSDQQSMDGGFISSPMYPAKSRYNNSIRWNFETKLDSILQFDLISLDLGSTYQDCQDTLNIFDGLNLDISLKLSQMCGHLSFKNLKYKTLSEIFGSKSNINILPVYQAYDPRIKSNLIRSVRTTTNVATVSYDNFRNEGSFLLRYKAIEKVSLVNQMQQKQNGDDIAPLDAIEALRDQDDSSAQSANDVKNVTKACSHSYRLSFGPQNMSQVSLMSPNWPQQPPLGIECHWLIYTQENTNIKLSVDPSDLSKAYANDESMLQSYDRKSDYCLDSKATNEKRNFIAVHDGATRLSPTIARYCLPVPPVQFQSSGRHLLIRYVHTDPYEPTNGVRSLFKSQASIGECGGQYHILSSARIRDRQNRNKKYANNLNCKYYIFAANQDRVLMIHNEMSEFDLSSEPSDENCSIGDYIEIRDLPTQTDLMDFSRSVSGRLLGRFCAGHKLEFLESPGSAISIEFKTDGQSVANGWELYVMSALPRVSCPRGYIAMNLDEPFGRFTSPNWPHGFFGKRYCKYHFVAPANQSILVTFVRLSRPMAADINGQQSPKCLDSIRYLADNEANSLRFDPRPLQDLQSPLSGTLMQQLVKEVPCKRSELLELIKIMTTPGKITAEPDNGDKKFPEVDSPGFKKIDADDYYKLLQSASRRAFTIKTNSHILLLDYQAKNLLPKEGFVAIYRLVDDWQFKCGGELTYQGSNLAASNAVSGASILPPKNLIESAKFGEETLESEDYIQCDWILKTGGGNSLDYLDSPRLSIGFNMIRTTNVGDFKTAYIVFNTLEIPPLSPGGSLYDEEWSNERVDKSSEICGLNRLIVSASYYIGATFACGNLSGVHKWTLVDYNVRRISLRTKNLRIKNSLTVNNGQEVVDNSNSNESNITSTTGAIHRGVRGYFYEKTCLQIERLVGEGARFRSHRGYPNDSYAPGICRWELRLNGGDYELWFDSVQFRPPENYANGTVGCDTNNSDLDYLEIRASIERDSPVLARYCIYNQLATKQKALILNMKSDIVILFVAGIKQLALGSEKFAPTVSSINQVSGFGGAGSKQMFGFDMELIRIKNESESEFCRRDIRHNIYWFIKSKDHDYYDNSVYSILPSLSSFLYPKNSHCIVNMNLGEGSRFNMSFKGIFDFELSKDCQNDYIQIDDLISVANPNTIATMSSVQVSNTSHLSVGPKNEPIVKRIGRWCGRTKPGGYFLSSSNKIRITFHSNERIEGKGFQLEYSTVPINFSSI